MKDVRLFAFWLVCFEAIAAYCSARGGDGPRLAIAGCSLIWIGLMVGISFTESWLKFRSKLLERQIGLDVGRLVFDGLNTLEVALAITIGTVLCRFEPFQERIWAIPVALLFILLLQVMYLTPSLELRSLYLASDLLSKKKHATKTEEEVFKEFTALLTLRPIPSQSLHHAYVLLELVKIGGLLKFVDILMFG